MKQGQLSLYLYIQRKFIIPYICQVSFVIDFLLNYKLSLLYVLAVSEDLNHVRIVELTHDVSGSLGLSIAGGIGSSLGDTAVLIANLTPGGAAARSQKLKVCQRRDLYL